MTTLKQDISDSSCGLKKKFSKKKLLDFLPRHAKFTPEFFQKLQKIPNIILENRASPIALKAYKMAKEVGREFDHGRSFTRTEVNAHGVMAGIVALEHSTQDLILQYFHDRFPAFTILLYNQTKKESYLMHPTGQMENNRLNLKENLELLNGKLPIQPNFEKLRTETKDIEVFKEFYASQFIAERENRRYFHHMIPKKWMKYPGLKVEREFRNHNLDRFIKKPKV